MIDYNKETKKQLIELIEHKDRLMETTLKELSRIVKDAEEDSQKIHGLMVDLKLYEMTIARLTVDETIRIEQESSDG